MSIFERAKKALDEKNKDSLVKSLKDVHHAGVYSLVIKGTENGALTRIFYAVEDINPGEVCYHNHCYDLNLGVVKGELTHYIADEYDGRDSVEIKQYTYHSPLNGGNGLEFNQVKKYLLSEYIIPENHMVNLSHCDIHTVSVKAGTIWIIEELGKVSDTNIVLGDVFKTELLYNTMSEDEINKVYDHILLELNTLLQYSFLSHD